MASSKDSGQGFIARNRKPRVHISYEDPYDADKRVELPFVMGVMADLSGNASEVAKPDMNQRKFLDIDMDTLDKRMAAIQPGLAMKVPHRLGDSADKDGEGRLAVELHFSKMEDFAPAEIARRVPALKEKLEAREKLSNLLRYMDGKAAAEEALRKLLADRDLMTVMQGKLKPGATPDETEK